MQIKKNKVPAANKKFVSCKMNIIMFSWFSQQENHDDWQRLNTKQKQTAQKEQLNQKNNSQISGNTNEAQKEIFGKSSIRPKSS